MQKFGELGDVSFGISHVKLSFFLSLILDLYLHQQSHPLIGLVILIRGNGPDIPICQPFVRQYF